MMEPLTDEELDYRLAVSLVPRDFVVRIVTELRAARAEVATLTMERDEAEHVRQMAVGEADAARAEIERLEQDMRNLRDERDRYAASQNHEKCWQNGTKLLAEVDRLRAALGEAGRHIGGCSCATYDCKGDCAGAVVWRALVTP